MGFFDVLDKIKGITQPYNDDEELLDELQENDIPVVQTVRSAQAQSASQPRERRQSGASRYRDFGGGYSEPRNTTSSAPARSPVREQEKVVNLHTAERPQMKFVKIEKLITEEAFKKLDSSERIKVNLKEEVLEYKGSDLIDDFCNNRTILLNLEKVGKEETKLLIYLLSGAACALDGKMRSIGSSTYAVIPHGVEYTGGSYDKKDNSESDGSGSNYEQFRDEFHFSY